MTTTDEERQYRARVVEDIDRRIEKRVAEEADSRTCQGEDEGHVRSGDGEVRGETRGEVTVQDGKWIFRMGKLFLVLGVESASPREALAELDRLMRRLGPCDPGPEVDA